MAIDFNKMIIKSCVEAYLFEKATDKIKAMYDEITTFKVTGDSTETEVEGRNGTTIAILDSKKKLGIEFENAYYTMDGLATQAGGVIKTATSTEKAVIRRFETVALSADKTLTLSDTPVTKTIEGASSQVLVQVCLLNKDSSPKETISGATVADKTVTLTDGNEGDLYRVVYDTERETAVSFTDVADEFAGTYRCVANLVCEDPCNHTEYVIQVDVPSYKVKTAYEIATGDSPSTMKVSGTALKDICGKDKKFCTYTLVE